MKLEELMSYPLKFYGVDNSVFCVSRGRSKKRVAFEAVEDNDDGYRSMLDEVTEVSVEGHIFFNRPIATVLLQKAVAIPDEWFQGWKLVDSRDGHVWLWFGTNYSDGYYPVFTFEYIPKR